MAARTSTGSQVDKGEFVRTNAGIYPEQLSKTPSPYFLCVFATPISLCRLIISSHCPGLHSSYHPQKNLRAAS